MAFMTSSFFEAMCPRGGATDASPIVSFGQSSGYSHSVYPRGLSLSKSFFVLFFKKELLTFFPF
jgi:hypothetical protein